MLALRAILWCGLALGAVSHALAQTVSGDFLAGQAAIRANDYKSAAQYFDRAFGAAPQNLGHQDSAMRAYLALGHINHAAKMAHALEAQDYTNPTTDMLLTLHAFANGRYDDALKRLKNGTIISEPIDPLLQAWAHFGAGRVSQALQQFDELAQSRRVANLALTQKALAHAMIGDFESAETLYAGDDTHPPLPRTVRGVQARAQGLAQMGQVDQALELLDSTFGTGRNPVADDLRFRISIGAPVEFDIARDAKGGAAEVLYFLSHTLQNERTDDVVLVYAQFARFLAPQNVDATLLVAEVLEDLGNHDLATLVYVDVPRGHPSFVSAEIGRASALEASDQADTAIEVLRQLSETNPAHRRVHIILGDHLRRQKRYQEAIFAYGTAIDLIPQESEIDWYVYFVRGIAHERSGDFESSDLDFRKSIALSPNRHQVLNYLGYSMVERQINMEEALDLIKQAVDLQPDAGYIVDSLGWVLYRMGQYADAVNHMEKAAELMATDPVVNDHLGDVYWAVGRKSEARFQWRRAASFITPNTSLNDIDPARVHRKLEVGLDQVLAEEGAPPLKVADDN